MSIRLITSLFVIAFWILQPLVSPAAQILVPMDVAQKDHLKAYGIAFWVLQKEQEVDWLLNYRGGSFAFRQAEPVEKELLARGVSYQVLSDAAYQEIISQIAHPDANMDVMKLEKVPKIAVYSPPMAEFGEDAVTLVLTYAEIPYELVFDEEVLEQKLLNFDWLHLHHEDFTGQYGRSIGRRRGRDKFLAEQQEAQRLVVKYGYDKVSQMKHGVAMRIKEFVAGGGFMFAMCSATDTYDIALAAEGVDIVDELYDGDGIDPDAQQKLDFTKTFAFHNFVISQNGYDRGFSSIDNQRWERGIDEENDFFSLFTFSAKWDPIPTMLTQNHSKTIKGFMGQTTAFKKEQVKPEVNIMGELQAANEVRYMNGTVGKGTWTFYGGHDPEAYQARGSHYPTDLSLYPNSPGYRLILNNILFPAAKKKKPKT
ncbi:asparagine synthetase B [Pontibacter qinzhouensis]|uniref:Asparagine synthetase B n=1 Tax=Pontibacter qinzhouensis TaxID=2603253 RepID=A0A5C8KA23_9BACT|nr:asparagine synthetase B [Pontibacter qinzhouensis]TXK51895.1 asparagine synthetase B [Pontibacter qinzhouensis]